MRKPPRRPRPHAGPAGRTSGQAAGELSRRAKAFEWLRDASYMDDATATARLREVQESTLAAREGSDWFRSSICMQLHAFTVPRSIWRFVPFCILDGREGWKISAACRTCSTRAMPCEKQRSGWCPALRTASSRPWPMPGGGRKARPDAAQGAASEVGDHQR